MGFSYGAVLPVYTVGRRSFRDDLSGTFTILIRSGCPYFQAAGISA